MAANSRCRIALDLLNMLE